MRRGPRASDSRRVPLPLRQATDTLTSPPGTVSPRPPSLQPVTAAAAEFQLLWTENVISVGGAFNVLLFSDSLISQVQPVFF